MKDYQKVLVGCAIALILTSCAGLGTNYSSNEKDSGKLNISFSMPVSETKSVSVDTNSFILSIVSTSGETVYSGKYGKRPREMTVKAGTYEIEAFSREFDKPTFDAPQYADRQIVVVSNGQQANVSLLCRRNNAGIKLTFRESFRNKYPDGNLLLMQPSGGLLYSFDEERTGYFLPGDIYFIHKDDYSNDTLFIKNVSAGQVFDLTLNASSENSSAGFSLEVDVSADTLSQTLTIGDRYSGADGSSVGKALDLMAAKSYMGDSVWVWGYIVGGDLTTSGISFNAPFLKSSNLALATSPSERMRDNCFSVELSRKAVKEALNLVDNPGNLGHKVFLRGVVSTYFSLTGLKGVTEYELH